MAIIVLPHPVVQIALIIEKYHHQNTGGDRGDGNWGAAEHLISFSFSRGDAQSQLHWTSPSQFDYKGQSFSVKDSKIDGDRIHILALSDRGETDLDRKLDRLAWLGKRTKTQHTNRVQILAFDFDFNLDTDIPKPPTEVRISPDVHCLHAVYAAFIEPASPPPKSSVFPLCV